MTVYIPRYIFSYTAAVRKVKRGGQWWILVVLVREFSSFANKRPAGRRRRPRWQLKFHFNPEFPQYFSIPPGLVLLSVVLPLGGSVQASSRGRLR